MRRKKIYTASVLLFFCHSLIVQATAALPKGPSVEDKIRIKEAISIKDRFAKNIWEGMENTPFALLLITDSVEYLMFHPNPSAEFKSLGHDPMLDTEIYGRPQELNPGFLATFPLFDHVPVIIVGTPENTGKSSSEWIITLLHEHFHQYQMSDKNYQSAVAELGLQGEDQSGMWMLNYPFPYTDSSVQEVFQEYAMSLSLLIQEGEKESFQSVLKEYRQRRKKLKETLSEKDYSYFSFQVWQEGIARYNEWAFLQEMKNYLPSQDCQQLEDFVPFPKVTEDLYARELARLIRLKLDTGQRTSFYSIGFGEGILLDKLNKEWKKKYLKDKFYVENYVQTP